MIEEKRPCVIDHSENPYPEHEQTPANAEEERREVERCVHMLLYQPVVHFPLRASRFAQEQDLPQYVVVEAFRRMLRL